LTKRGVRDWKQSPELSKSSGEIPKENEPGGTVLKRGKINSLRNGRTKKGVKNSAYPGGGKASTKRKRQGRWRKRIPARLGGQSVGANLRKNVSRKEKLRKGGKPLEGRLTERKKEGVTL